MNLLDITDGELLVMKCLWDEDRPLSVEEIIGGLKGKFHKDNKCSTVYTFLSRLREKGYVDSYECFILGIHTARKVCSGC